MLKILQCTGEPFPSTKSYVQKVNSAKVVKPWARQYKGLGLNSEVYSKLMSLQAKLVMLILIL